ncbi:MAG: AI-2E family transporter [Rubrimonas sp.]
MHERFRNLVYAVALALMLGNILVAGRSVFVPVVIAILLVYVILGVSRLLALAQVQGRAMPEFARLPVAALLILLLVAEVGALLLGGVAAVAARAPDYQDSFMRAMQQAAAFAGLEREPSWEALRADLIGQMDVQGLLRSLAMSATALVGVQFFILLNVAFILMERGAFEAKIAKLTDDPRHVRRIRLVVDDINQRISRYLAVKTLINIALGLISWAIMGAFGVEFAALWAVMIALFNYVPYVGSFVGVAFPAVLAVAQFGDLNTVLALVVLLTLAQMAMGNVIEPRVMGDALNLSPWVVLVSLTVWTSLWGVAGAVVSVPITAIMVVVFSEFDRTRPLAVLMSRNGDAPRRPFDAEEDAPA